MDLFFRLPNLLQNTIKRVMIILAVSLIAASAWAGKAAEYVQQTANLHPAASVDTVRLPFDAIAQPETKPAAIAGSGNSELKPISAMLSDPSALPQSGQGADRPTAIQAAAAQAASLESQSPVNMALNTVGGQVRNEPTLHIMQADSQPTASQLQQTVNNLNNALSEQVLKGDTAMIRITSGQLLDAQIALYK